MKSTRYFVKSKDGEPMDTYRIGRDNVHPRRLYPHICAILIEQGYLETDFRTEWDAHDKIMKIVNACPTWREGNIELERRRNLVNAIKISDIYQLANEKVIQQKQEPRP